MLAGLLTCVISGSAQQTTAPQIKKISESSIRGWLSDEQCAHGRAESGTFTATNPRCAKECVAKGRKVVLIDPERKQIFNIANASLAKKNIGDYVEIVGETDLSAKTIRISSLKMLEHGSASCSRPQLKN